MLDIKLLLVEDDIDLLKKLEKILKREVKELSISSNPIEAIKSLENSKPDLIITDIKMPQMNGLDMIESIRELCPNIPVIVASAFSDPDFFQKAIKLKIEKFVIKPIDLDDLIESIKNIAQKIELEKKMIANNKLLNEYKSIVDKSTYITKTDKYGKITYVNDKFETLSGYSKEELLGQNHNITRHPDMPSSFFKRLWETISNKQTWQGKIKNLDKNGKTFIVETTISPILDENDEIVEFISIKNDITQLVENRKLLQKEIITDNLTRVPNRIKLKNDVNKVQNPTLILVDINGFQEINNLFGFYFGDEILIYLANILNEEISTLEAKCYRVSADEFAILFFTQIDIETVRDIILKIEARIKNEPFNFNSIQYNLNLSYGVASTKSSEKNMILALAETAMSSARKNNLLFEIYTQEIDQQKTYENNFKWNRSLKEALEENRIEVYYQPIVNIRDSEDKKYECLVRYIEKDGEVISPFHFLDIAKRSRIYHDITRRVITLACEAFAKTDAIFSINFSIEDFYNLETVDYLIEMVNKNNLKGKLIVEILESEGIDNFNYTIDIIERLKSNGIKIAIDDFGTGYSNFSYLISLDVDILKIDGSLITDIDKDKSKQSILQSIMFFTKELNIKTVAEFVSSEEIYDVVKEFGVDYAQGYYFDKPLNYEELIKKVNKA